MKQVLLTESRNPYSLKGGKKVYNKKTIMKELRSIASILVNRLNSKNQKQFYLKNAKFLYDVLVSKGQFKGFSDNGGVLKIKDDRRDIINDIIRFTYTGRRGKILNHMDKVAKVAREAVTGRLKDPAEKSGGTYFMRTEGRLSPGGKSKYLHTSGGNDFYTIKQEKKQ